MFKIIQPPVHLAKYIVCFWVGRFDSSRKNSFVHLAHATTKPQLLFHLEGVFEEIISPQQTERTFDAGIYGQSASHKQYQTGSRAPKIFGVQLYPHALTRLLGIPADELCNESVDIHSILGKQGREVSEKIFSTDCDIKRANIISAFLARRLTGREKMKHGSIVQAIHRIEKCRGEVCIQELIDQSCLSQRQFERNFKELSGFSPKAYLRIVRFESLLDHFVDRGTSLTSAALEFGYYDQSHLNHDFKAFTGLSPLQYLNFYSAQYC